ncbi:LysR substrate-binding domain-containing protein [Acinetobacter baumannii]|uniref:LysR substrate-binding domain-containing protein n=1 Tax=Acinetobacter baumannii TaxID=470 RepID=UPI003AF4E47D
MAKQLPPLYALRAFESAARTGTASLAAEELHLTQSAVSKHIKTLENYFDCQLFTRRGPRMVVTPQGQIFAEGLKYGFKQIEEACAIFQSHRGVLRLKAPSTLTMRWLLSVLRKYRETDPGITVQTSSIWMDIDSVDFFSEPYDCAILLGAGYFGDGTCSVKLFDEWLIPICAPSLLNNDSVNLLKLDIIHPSPDKRDWRRWLARAKLDVDFDMTRGEVFDTLEQGNAAAIAGHGISIGDLALCSEAIANKQLVLPFKTAVSTGDGYYLVWPEMSGKDIYIRKFLEFLKGIVPTVDYPDLVYK